MKIGAAAPVLLVGLVCVAVNPYVPGAKPAGVKLQIFVMSENVVPVYGADDDPVCVGGVDDDPDPDPVCVGGGDDDPVCDHGCDVSSVGSVVRNWLPLWVLGPETIWLDVKP